MAVSVVIGGSTGIGLVIAQRLSARGDDVVVTSRDRATAEAVAQTLGPSASGLALDLGKPETIAAALADVQAVDNLSTASVRRLVTIDEIAAATAFLLGSAGVGAHDLVADGGVLVT